LHFAATIERAEKQIILAKHARRLLNLVDDTPIVPGDTHPAFAETEAARVVLNDAESDLQGLPPGRGTCHVQLWTPGCWRDAGQHSSW
jgi:hypothetical protein